VPPTAPTALQVTGVSGSSVSLAWTASTDNVGVTGYRVLRDGALVTTTSATSFTDTGLADAKTYEYEVVALDGGGNISAPSNPATATTLDITAPTAAPGLAVGSVTASSITLSWGAATDNVGVTGYRVFRNGAPVGGDLTARTFTDTGLALGTTYTYTVVAFDAASNTSPPSTSVQATTLANVTTPVTLIAAGSSWRYLDNGVDQGTTWRNPTFNDTTWKVGNAQFGYGEGDEATVVSYGGDPDKRYVTTYFRKTINVANPAALSTIVLGLLRDDGAVVYLNGVEIARSNMPTGTVAYKTQPDINVPTADENTYFPYAIPAALFTTGTNTIAVELHQKGWTNNDLSFDLRLTANQTS
jgi:chitodextrinase